ncbi:sensor domain-containing phosphodiesterase [Oricola cellulosilytica]|nr:EAL domain-containing protein [Oricola cellulosilytica]
MPEHARRIMEALAAGSASGDLVQDALEAIRKHLGMEVAYLSEFVDGRSVFRRVDAPGLEHLIKPGDSQSLEDVYCNHILEGRLPELIPNTAKEPLARAMPITDAVPIGSHVSIPIRLADGTPYGMFCCLSPAPNETLNDRDLQTMKMFADLAARHVSEEQAAKTAKQRTAERIRRAIDTQAFRIAYQPIWNLNPLRPVGMEALCRFDENSGQTPDIWFREADEAGLGAELEMAVIRKALESLPSLPEDVYLSVNASPGMVAGDTFAGMLESLPLKRVVLEITEHARVEDYRALDRVLAPLRASGLRVAVDDAGAGYASLQHIVQLRPNLIKLDMTLTRDIDKDRARRSLAAALIFFAAETGTRIVAEGIETEGELNSLMALGVASGQGYLLGRPVPLADAIELCAKRTDRQAQG